MPIRGYVWNTKPGHIGHVSLELSDGTYISWWPEEKIQSKLGAVFSNIRPVLDVSLLKDIEAEEGQPDRAFILPDDLGLNEKRIKEWWEEMKKEGKYNLLGNNCCAAVKRALKAGGLSVERELIETPPGMVDYFQYLVQHAEYDGPRRKKIY